MENNMKTKIQNYRNMFLESDELTKMPKKLRNYFTRVYVLRLILMVSTRIPSILIAAGTTIFGKNPILSIVLIISSVIINSIGDTIELTLRENEEIKEASTIEFLESIASKMLVVTRNRVQKTEKEKTEILTTPTIVDIIHNRFRAKFSIIQQIIENTANCLFILFTLISLIKLLEVQASGGMIFFYIIIITSLILKIVIFAKELKRRREDYEDRKKVRRNLGNASRDLKEVEPMSNKHIEYMLSKLLKHQNISLEYNRKELKYSNRSSFLTSIINSAAIILVIVKIAFNGGLSNLAFLNLAGLVALAQLFQNILSVIEGSLLDIFLLRDAIEKYKKDHEDYKLVYNVYKMYADDVEAPYEGNTYVVKPFEYTYNNTKFTLKSLVNLVFKRGELTLLDCASGGGKSTTAKIAIGEIKVRPGKVTKIPAVKYFNDESKLGSGNLFEEVTLEIDESKVDLEKLYEIIEGTKLSSKFKTIDDLKKVVSVELSNGMYQRMLLARTLYNLGDSDMVIIDEPIGSIDKKTAIEVMRFVKEFINRDKKRFGIVCTHQAEFIEEFIDNTYTITSISPTLSEIK